MSKDMWVTALAFVPLFVLAGALVVLALRSSRANTLERNMQYRFTVEPGERLPLAPGEWTIYPGESKIQWKGERLIARAPSTYATMTPEPEAPVTEPS